MRDTEEARARVKFEIAFNGPLHASICTLQQSDEECKRMHLQVRHSVKRALEQNHKNFTHLRIPIVHLHSDAVVRAEAKRDLGTANTVKFVLNPRKKRAISVLRAQHAE